MFSTTETNRQTFAFPPSIFPSKNQRWHGSHGHRTSVTFKERVEKCPPAFPPLDGHGCHAIFRLGRVRFFYFLLKLSFSVRISEFQYEFLTEYLAFKSDERHNPQHRNKRCTFTRCVKCHVIVVASSG